MYSCGSYVYNNLARFNSGVQFFYLTSSCTNLQPLCKVVQLVYNIHKVVSTLQKLMEGCLKFATTFQGCNNLVARLLQPRNFYKGNTSLLFVFSISCSWHGI